MDASVIASLFLGLGALGISVYTLRASRQKLEAEGAESITNAAIKLIQPLKEELAEVRREVEHLEVELRLWRELSKRRGDQVIALGGDPITFEAVHAEWGGLNKEDR